MKQNLKYFFHIPLFLFSGTMISSQKNQESIIECVLNLKNENSNSCNQRINNEIELLKANGLLRYQQEQDRRRADDDRYDVTDEGVPLMSADDFKYFNMYKDGFDKLWERQSRERECEEPVRKQHRTEK